MLSSSGAQVLVLGSTTSSLIKKWMHIETQLAYDISLGLFKKKPLPIDV